MILYIIVSILWGIYAGRQNAHRYNSGIGKQILGFIFNAGLCPIAIILAIIWDETHTPIYFK